VVFADFCTSNYCNGSRLGIASEFAISVVCPQDSNDFCVNNPTVTLKAHWVCAGDVTDACEEADFHLTATINGTVTFGTEGGVSSSGDQVAAPPCGRGYLIAWVVDNQISDNPIKFDGLLGQGVRRGNLGDWTLTAIPIQAAEGLTTGDQTAADLGGALAFDGDHYREIGGTAAGPIRYQQAELLEVPPPPLSAATPVTDTHLIFLTLDVVSNQVNPRTDVALDFYNEHEGLISGAAYFFCYDYNWSVEGINEELDSDFGVAGLVRATALQGSNPATVMVIVETEEDVTSPSTGSKYRKYVYRLLNGGPLVPTVFAPSGVAGPTAPSVTTTTSVKPLVAAPNLPATPGLPPLPKLP